MNRYVVLAGGVVVADDIGRLPLFATPTLASVFAVELEKHTDASVAILSLDSQQVVQLLTHNGLDEPDSYDVETQTENAEDAITWARELAERCARATPPGDLPS